MISRINKKQIQSLFTKWAAAGGGAKAGRARGIARISYEGGCFIRLNPVRVFIFGGVKICFHQKKRLGIARPDTDNRSRGIILMDFF